MKLVPRGRSKRRKRSQKNQLGLPDSPQGRPKLDPASLPVSLSTEEWIEEALNWVTDGYPGAERHLVNRVLDLVSRQLSTGAVAYLMELCDRLPDSGLRMAAAKRAHLLRHEYLESHKEFSDRALILLAEREKLAERWEGIYLLGVFAGESGRQYLEQQLPDLNPVLKHAAAQAIKKIHRRLQAKKQERGF